MTHLALQHCFDGLHSPRVRAWALDMAQKGPVMRGHIGMTRITSNKINMLGFFKCDTVLEDYLRPDGSHRYLPIEFFKLDRTSLEQGSWERWFQSSGTSAASRSISPFRFEGLEAYKAGSILAFNSILTELLDFPESAQIVSLVPPPSTWTDSSLSQMLGWFSEVWPVTWVSEVGDLGSTVTKLDPARPMILFGTAFHWVHWLDRGETLRLPTDALVIETGGTKGKSRAIGRDELYQSLQRQLTIQPHRIVSEYGMCELAAQAYDWIPRNTQSDISLSERRFRFPVWVEPRVLTDADGPPVIAGSGVLVVDDPLRFDFPLPLRTQDLVVLEADGGFVLRGRVPSAPLKGCSLRAEDVVTASASGVGRSFPLPFAMLKVGVRMTGTEARIHARGDGCGSAPFREGTVESRIPKLQKIFDTLFADPTFQNLWEKELGHPVLARDAMMDLQSSLPHDAAAWLGAAREAWGGSLDAAGAEEWLFVLPSSHSMAGFYPVALGYLLGLRMWVRRPWNETRAIDGLISRLQQVDPQVVHTLGADFRIGESPVPQGCGGILVYGEDNTLADIRAHTIVPVQGFGSSVGISMAHASEQSVLEAILHDTLALGQRGCLSSRLWVIWSEDAWTPSARRAWFSACRQQVGEYLKEPLPVEQACGVESAWFELQMTGHEKPGIVDFKPGEPIFVGYEDPSMPVTDLIQNTPFVVPVVFCGSCDGAALMTQMRRLPGINLIGASPRSLAGLSSQTGRSPHLAMVVAAGRMNQPRWDGWHQGRRLFVIG